MSLRMIKLIGRENRPLFRMIIPAFPRVNIYTREAKLTTALGPLMVATAANNPLVWKVEVIDENNYNGPCAKDGLPDYSAMEPADVVGFYCGLSSTMQRVWQLAEFYSKAFTIAGGWHAHYMPEETLRHNIDLIVHGDGELVIGKILEALRGRGILEAIPGISFLENKRLKTTNASEIIQNLNRLPCPDFGLLKYAKIKTYPIGRIRGCSRSCEFCSVKGKPRFASPEHLFSLVENLVSTRRARRFFITDDRLEEDLEGTIKFFEMIYQKYGNQLWFMVQVRLEAAKNNRLLETMKKAGVSIVCIGYESPIDEDLKAMRKGYLSHNMVEWTRVWQRYFWVHGMFIAAYPGNSQKQGKEIIQHFKRFIRKTKLDSIQVLLPSPLVGTDLRKRLESQKRLFPLEAAPWNLYDGNFALFEPEAMSLEEFQKIHIKLMRWFYNPFSFVWFSLRTLTFPAHYFVRGWKNWYKGWRRQAIKYGGYHIVQKWIKSKEDDMLIARIKEYKRPE